MNKTLKVGLSDCRFYSYHGFYPEEQILGTEFYVDIVAEYIPSKPINDALEHTLNYETVYQVVAEEMNIPRKLIETVAQRILDRVRAITEDIQHISISVRKNNPPFGNDRAQATITLEQSFCH